MKKKWIIIGIIVVVALGFGYRFWRNRQARLAATQIQANLATATVKRDTIENTITGTANIASVDKRVIKSSVTGTVEKLLVEDGQPVKLNQIIAILRNDDLLSQYEQAKVDLESARLTLKSYRNPTAGDKASVTSKLAQAQSAVENRRRDVEKLTIKSPINGRVISVNANVGDTASTSAVMVSVADDTTLLAMVSVPQTEISKIVVGQKASLAFGSELPTTTGVVDGIGAEGVTSGGKVVVPVGIKFSNGSRVYRSGLAVNASIIAKDDEDDDEDETVYVSGSVAPQLKYDLRAEAGGTVEEVLVKDGDEVKAGQVLVKLSSRSVLTALQAAESDLEVAKENLELLNSGLAPQVTESQVQQQELRIMQAEFALNKRAADVDALQIKSPIDGILVSHAIAAGDTVVDEMNCFVVADYSKMQMVIPVDELDIIQVKVGQKASVTVEALPGRTFVAEVTKIATEGVIKDGIANYDVTLTLTDTKDIRGAMTGNAEIVLARKENVLVIPAEAVRTVNNKKYVNVLTNGAGTQVEIKTGLTNGIITEVVSGLNEGDVIAISDQRSGTTNMGGPFGGQRAPAQPQPARPGGR